MNLYYNILKTYLKHEVYAKYHTYLDYKVMKDEVPETFKLFTTLKYMQDQKAKDYTLDDLEVSLFTLYPNTSSEEFKTIFSQIRESNASEETVKTYLHEVYKRSLANDMARKALAVGEGNDSSMELMQSIEQYTKEILHNPEHQTDDQNEDFVNDDLELLKETQFTTPGLRWRLQSLNKNLGSLRQGDFGFIFARPETGKTTFLASEISFMVEQTTNPILWFNNEEQGSKVQLRCYQASLGLPALDLYSDTARFRMEYSTRSGNRIKIIADPSITRKRVEELCERYSPALVIFDQIDKIKGFSEDRNDLELKAIYIWARELAKQYCPVIGVCQAGASGDFKRWLTMNDVDNSKTGKQGEADWILGIGKVADEGLEFVRYLHLSKNKLLGDKDANPEMRHGKWEVKIKPEIARYEDFT